MSDVNAFNNDLSELCWQTGNYTDNCECEFCNHKEECSRYEDDED